MARFFSYKVLFPLRWDAAYISNKRSSHITPIVQFNIKSFIEREKEKKKKDSLVLDTYIRRKKMFKENEK